MNKFEYKKLTPFKWFVLENFPFIEADFDAITEWQLFNKLGNEINKIINKMNLCGEQTENLTIAFNNLKNYVDNYFENLDIQEEINNKLNEMAEDGTLEQIIAQYLNTQAINSFASVSDMKNATNLINNSYVKTFGFHNSNDGGGAFYKIRNIENTDVVNEMNIIALNNINLIAEFIPNGIINPKQFGAIDSQTEDQSAIISEIINYCFDNNIKQLNLNGAYFINNTMSFTNKSNLLLKNGILLVHEDDALLNNEFNILHFTDCSNIQIDNIKCIELNPVARSRKLYVGGLLFTNCNNCKIYNCYLENICSGIMLMNGTKNSFVENNTIITNFSSSQFSQSAILNYSAKNNIIKNNIIYGEFYDGVLSIFGGGTKDVIVDSNELHGIVDGITPLTIVQGITIDQGCLNTIISNNIIYDFFYGIDNKANTQNTKIQNNILVGNKISIADRQGETSTASLTYGCTIENNKIIIREDWDTNALASYLQYGVFYYVGITSALQQGASIKNNNISVFGQISKPVSAINVRNYETTSNQYLQNNIVIGNNIELSTGFGSTTSNAPANSVGIILYNCKKGIFTNNTFKVDTIGNYYNMFQLRGENTNLKISENYCRCTSTSNHHFVNLFDETSSCKNSDITNNKLINCSFNNLNSITNFYDFITGDIARRTKTVAVTTEWVDLFKITTQYANPVHVKLKAIVSSAGIKYIDGDYILNLSGTNVNVTELKNNNNGIDIQFINDGTDNTAICQVKSTRGFNLYVDVYQLSKYGTPTYSD